MKDDLKEAPKLKLKIIFVSATKIGENATNVLSYYTSN